MMIVVVLYEELDTSAVVCRGPLASKQFRLSPIGTPICANNNTIPRRLLGVV
jgi:hypothetical protein